MTPPLKDTETIKSLSAIYAGKHLIITGTTGFLGKVWLTMLLCELPTVGRLTLLIRPGRAGDRRRVDGFDRFVHFVDTNPACRPLRERYGSDLGALLHDKVRVVTADMSQPQCGLDDEDLATLCDADAVVHCAGLTDFQPDPIKGLSANVDGALHAADIAATLDVPRLVHISTCYVTGVRPAGAPGSAGSVEEVLRPCTPNGTAFDPQTLRREFEAVVCDPSLSGSDRIDAGADFAVSHGWPNLYTFTKALAEYLLDERDDISLTIVRPSIVECAVDFPFAGWNEGINTSGPVVWYARSAFGFLPAATDHPFDIIPVDMVCRWMTLITARALQDRARAIYQLASSEENPVTFGRIIDLNGLAVRKHEREWSGFRALVRHLDTIPVSADEPGWWSPSGLRSLSKTAARVFGAVESQEGVGKLFRSAAQSARRTDRTLKRIEKMLEVYRPFTHDNHWVFSTANIRRELAQLAPGDEALFGARATDICWRKYWIDVQYPGLVKWSLPLMRGERAPLDAPCEPPLSIRPSQLRGVGK